MELTRAVRRKISDADPHKLRAAACLLHFARRGGCFVLIGFDDKPHLLGPRCLVEKWEPRLMPYHNEVLACIASLDV